MRGSPVQRDEPSLENRLAQLDAQLRTFEASLRAHQQSHGRVRSLELELAAIVERGAAVVRELAAFGDHVREGAERATRDALAPSADRVRAFEEHGARILEAYSQAVRAAQQAVARAEARIDAFDERVGRELAQAGREIRDAAQLLREHASGEPSQDPARISRVRRLIPVVLAATLLLIAFGLYSWMAHTLREASARADTAERRAHDIGREADQRIASIEDAAKHASLDAASSAARTERMVNILAAPDAQRMVMSGYGTGAAASGLTLWSPSRGVLITGTRLPDLKASETYQAWVVTTRGSVSLGFVRPEPGGSITGAFDLPSLTRPVRGFMITREPTGGSQRPSATVVLAS